MKTLEEKIQQAILEEIIAMESSEGTQRQGVYAELDSYKATLDCIEHVKRSIRTHYQSS